MDSTPGFIHSARESATIEIVFSSSDESVATVDQDGKTIHAIKVGQATISALPSLGFPVYEAQAAVMVVEVIPEVIKIQQINIKEYHPVSEDGMIYVTDELQLAVEILPENATYHRA